MLFFQIPPAASQTLTAIPTETYRISPTEKVDGFKIALAITMFLAAYKTGSERW